MLPRNNSPFGLPSLQLYIFPSFLSESFKRFTEYFPAKPIVAFVIVTDVPAWLHFAQCRHRAPGSLQRNTTPEAGVTEPQITLPRFDAFSRLRTTLLFSLLRFPRAQRHFPSSQPLDATILPPPSDRMPSAAENLPAPVADKLPRLPETKEELRETKEAAKSGLLSQLRALAAGGFGGICAVVVGHPFDLVKVRLQTAERGVYSSAVDVVRKSVARDGLRRGLYAGVSAPLVGVTPMCEFSPSLLLASRTGTKELILPALRKQLPSPSGDTTSASKSSRPRPPSGPTACPSGKSPRPASCPPCP